LQLHSFDEITRHHQHIFLSPHFDDVVYSCGGALTVQASPLVITIFAGAPATEQQLSLYADETQRLMGCDQDAASLVAIRRKEDARAMNFLGVDYLWLDYPDGIYRGDPAYYLQEEDLFGEIHPDDLELVTEMAHHLINLAEYLPDTIWYAPLGVGRHIDHQIVCSVAELLIQSKANIKLYEDFPYVAEANELNERLQEFSGISKPELVEISTILPTKQKASEMYASQIKLNFGERESMYKMMEFYSQSVQPGQAVFLERYWTAG